jgi:hypothetical protein
MSFEQELRNASDSMLKALEEVRDLEEQKRVEVPGTPRFVELARQVEVLALEILRRTEHQENLARESESLREAGEGVARPIAAIEPEGPGGGGDAGGAAASVSAAAAVATRELSAILEEWRGAERRLIDSMPGSDSAHAAADDVRRLRAEYARAYAARQQDPTKRF